MAVPPFLIVDNSDHGRAGSWFANCLGEVTKVEIRGRDDFGACDEAWGAVILTGSEASIFEDRPWIVKEADLVRRLATRGVPVFGVCFGHQLIFRSLYGKDALARRQVPEVGWPPVTVGADPVLGGGGRIHPYNFHFDEVVVVPDGWERFASSAGCPVHAVRNRSLFWYGVQFHPEVTPAEGAGGIRRMRDSLAGYGLDAETLAAGGEKKSYYPEIVRRFAVAVLNAGRTPK